MSRLDLHEWSVLDHRVRVEIPEWLDDAGHHKAAMRMRNLPPVTRDTQAEALLHVRVALRLLDKRKAA